MVINLMMEVKHRKIFLHLLCTIYLLSSNWSFSQSCICRLDFGLLTVAVPKWGRSEYDEV